MRINVNGRPKNWEKRTISFEEAFALAMGYAPGASAKAQTVAYSGRDADGIVVAGTLIEHESADIHEGFCISIIPTGSA